MHIPVLYPGDPGEALDLGRHEGLIRDQIRDGLERDQLELVAARTSLLNECFF